MDQSEVKKLWALLTECYGAQKETKERLAAWMLALAPYSYADVRESALQHVRESPFYPKISELTKRIPSKVDENAWMDEFIK